MSSFQEISSAYIYNLGSGFTAKKREQYTPNDIYCHSEYGAYGYRTNEHEPHCDIISIIAIS